MPDKLCPVKVELYRAEGPAPLMGCPAVFSGDDCLLRANGRLMSWRPSSGTPGYYKTDCTVYFEPVGVSYKLRIDLAADEYTTIGRELLRTVRFMAGEAKPYRYTEAEYEAYLAQFPGAKERNKGWLAYLDIEFLQCN